MRITEEILGVLACPVCKQTLHVDDSSCLCCNDNCREMFPIVNGKPVLLHEKNSLFHIKDYTASVDTSRRKEESRLGLRLLRSIIENLVPSITYNWVAKQNYAKLTELLYARPGRPRVLVVGGGEIGYGLNVLLDTEQVTLVETDIYFGPRVQMIADGHDLPFLDASFDAVILQAVLEHVLDPYRCIAEVYRVLRPDGLVYAESPFLYPVHLGAYDFTRFSLGAHRRLFRHFAQLENGVAGGPAQAVALAASGFARNLAPRFAGDFLSRFVLPFFLFWLKYCDYFLIHKPQAGDCASTVYFLGKKSDVVVSDEDIVRGHWSNRIAVVA
jgi:uncharacterized protein YbaR (Trm112 family)/SAM-dependent methyltransferase